MHSFTRRALCLAASVALVSAVVARTASAQANDSSSSLVGATRIDLNAGAWLSPGPVRSFAVSGDFAQFVTEHWQLGIAPALSATTGSGGSSLGAGLNSTLNYMVGAGRTRWFVGATAGASGGGGGRTLFGAQTGALWFLAPTAALRAELQSLRIGRSDFTSYGAFLTLDSYLPAGPTGVISPPDRGAMDVAFDASLRFNGGRERTINLMLAPFLTRWAQVGGRYSAISVPANGDWPTAQTFNGFGRLYAPLGPGAMPFVEGFVEATHFSQQTLQPPIAFGATAGVRHHLNNGIALDAGLQWRRSQSQSGSTVPAQDFVTLQAGLVTELRIR